MCGAVFDASNKLTMSSGNETPLSSFQNRDTSVLQVTTFFSSANDTKTNEQVSSNVQQIFYGLNVVVGILGFSANCILFALLFLDKKLRNNFCNVLILNQTSIDVFASFFLALTYFVKLQGIYYASGWSKFYCRMFDNNGTLAVALIASTSCLTVISLERYVKICHSILYKARLNRWMQKAAIVFPWIYAAIITFPITISTSEVMNGRCMSNYNWPALWVQQFYGVGNAVWKFLLPVSICIGCYARILLQMKKQGRIHAHSTTNGAGGGGGAPDWVSRSEKKIVMMLLYVVAFYLLSYTPINIYYALFNFNVVSIDDSSTFPLLLSLSYLNMCANPIIYAVKYQLLGGIASRLGLRKRPNTVDNNTSVQTPHLRLSFKSYDKSVHVTRHH